jgi:HSP20 family protein
MISTPIRFRSVLDPVTPLLRVTWPEQNGAVETNGHTKWSPALEVRETEDAFTILAELPGVKPEEMELLFEGGYLMIRGERRPLAMENGARVHCAEFRTGEFHRSVRLPAHVDADGIEARFEAGLLYVRVPKAEVARPRRISISTESNASNS